MKTYSVQVCHETFATLRETLAAFLVRRDRTEDFRGSRINPVELSAHAALDADRLIRDLVALLTARPVRPNVERTMLVL